MKKVRYWLEFIPLYLVVQLARILPRSGVRILAAGVAFLVGKILGLRREVVINNLQRAFPGLNAEERREICSDCYKFYARAGLEWFRTSRLLQQEQIEVEGAGPLEARQEAGQGAIIVTGHLGYWELSGAWIARRFGSITVYADVLHNPHVQRLIKNQRQDLNIDTVTGKWAMKDLAREVRQGRIVAFVADQSKGSQTARIPFFGSRVTNTRMPAFIARVTGAPVFPLAAVREGKQSINIKFSQPLPASKGSLEEADEPELLAEYNAWLEEMIRKYPEQYFWMHRRWKDAEPLENSS